jgi:enoyl-CoA hydratase/carnithine racemase
VRHLSRNGKKGTPARHAPPHPPQEELLSDLGKVEISRTGGCVTATLKRPAGGNRISSVMAAALMELAESIEDDNAASLMVITGAGNSFCAGFEPEVDHRLAETIAALSKPTVAIINGDAIDEGLELAMAMDIRVASFNARFALTHLKRGLLPHFGGTQRLTRLVGISNALKMLLTGEPIDGREALRMGLLTHCADSLESMRNAANQVISAVLGRGAIAERLVKEAVVKGFDMTLDQGIRLEEDLYALLQTTGDRAEGIKAFLEKRKPLFRGA